MGRKLRLMGSVCALLAISDVAFAQTKTPPNLTQATSIASNDLFLVWPTASSGPLKNVQFSTLESLLIAALGSSYLQVSNNLSDLANAGTARANLGLGGAAILNVGTTSGTVAAGDDSRFPTSTPCGISGCTFTGAIAGTSASFSGAISSATGSVTGQETAGSFAVDSSFYATLLSSNPVINFQANDYLLYNRTSNVFSVNIGGVTPFFVNSSGVTTSVLSATSGSFSGPVTATTGTFSGNVSGAAISGTSGSFSSTLSVSSTATFGGNATFNGNYITVPNIVGGTSTADAYTIGADTNSGYLDGGFVQLYGSTASGGAHLELGAASTGVVNINAGGVSVTGNEIISGALTAGSIASGSGMLATNAQVLAGTATTVVATPASLVNHSLNATGYEKLPGGLIIQWGAYTGGASSGTITFPVAFPTAMQSITAANNNSAAGNNGLAFNNSGGNTSSITWAQTGTNSFSWIAIGY